MSNQLVWIGIYFGIALVVTFFLPLEFPYSFLVVLAIIAPLSIYRRRRYLKKIGAESSFFGSSGMSGSQGGGVDYYCISCGTKHRETSCPNCGSKMKRVGF